MSEKPRPPPAPYKPHFVGAFPAGLALGPVATLALNAELYYPWVVLAGTAAVIGLGFGLGADAPSGARSTARTALIHFLPAMVGVVIGWFALIVFLLRGYGG